MTETKEQLEVRLSILEQQLQGCTKPEHRMKLIRWVQLVEAALGKDLKRPLSVS